MCVVLTCARFLQDSLNKDMRAIKEKDLKGTFLDSGLFSRIHES